MEPLPESPLTAVLARALPAAETERVEIGHALLARVPQIFRDGFHGRPALLIADPNTLVAAGKQIYDAFRASVVECPEPFVFSDPELYAEHRFVEELEAHLAGTDAIPIAVGSGTINDLTKLAAHRLQRPYLAVATAASVDGYTAFGASITHAGDKKTFSCPAPKYVVADLDVLCAAPPELNAAGYADFLAKVPAGADWMLADAFGGEPIDAHAWELVQVPLRAALDDPAGVRNGNPAALRKLIEGLMLCGLAMQWTRTSRPASGAEHMFSHLWDMEHHLHHGHAPAHGFKVGIATVAVTRLYEALFQIPVQEWDLEAARQAWPEPSELDSRLSSFFPPGPIYEKCREESAAKHPDRATLRIHQEEVRRRWPVLQPRLAAQLLPADELEQRLRAVGAPSQPEEIGISRERLRASFPKAAHLRRRYTVLDLALRLGLLGRALAS